MRLDKVRKVDCCREGSILIEHASYRASFIWLKGDTDNLDVGWWMYFKDLHKSIGLNIVACPFCGTPVPDVWEGSKVEDYQKFEDYIIINDSTRSCVGARKTSSREEYWNLEDYIIWNSTAELSKALTRPTCNNGETALYVTDILEDCEVGSSMGCDAMPNKCSICESNKCLYHTDLASEEWSEHVE